MIAVLELSRVTKYFGGLCAVNGLDFKVAKGELLGLIGPNGAGKTTVFNLISGVFKVSKGSIIFDGKDIANRSPHEINRAGICRTFQLKTVFDDLTVFDNVMLGGYIKNGLGIGLLDAFLTQRKRRIALERSAMEMIELVGLGDQKNELAKNLPHGFRQAMSIAMALITDPSVLLLDEPLSGMNMREIDWIMGIIDSIRRNGKRSVMLIEHHMKGVMKYCDRIVVINFGSKIAEGLPNEIKENEEVIAAYLGEKSYAA